MAKIVIPGGRRALPTPLTASEKQAIEDNIANVTIPAAVASNTAKVNDIENVTAALIIYVDSVSGDDANNGSSSGNAVVTFGRVLELMVAGRQNSINVSGNLTLTERYIVTNPPSSLVFQGAAGDGSDTVTAGGITQLDALWFRSSVDVLFKELSINLDNSDSTLGLINFQQGGRSSATFDDCIITQTVSNTSILIHKLTEHDVNATFKNTPVSTIQGKVFTNVASGVDPNLTYNISSNLTSA